MLDLASLMVTIHQVGGLTKFPLMEDWIINMSGNLMQEALILAKDGDFGLLDTLAAPDSFLYNMTSQ